MQSTGSIVRSETRQELWARLVAGAVFAGSAVFTWRTAVSMGGGMRMPGGWEMSMMWMTMPGQSLLDTARMFLTMWLAMMVAMMLPSAWPMLELYHRVAASTGEARPWLNTLLASAGYFGVWVGYGVLVFGAGFLVAGASMKNHLFSSAVPIIAGCGLVLAGIYQFSPWKQACLSHCRSPLLFLGHVLRPGSKGALRVGISHGLYCTGCCWALMMIQSILGVMSLLVMIAIAGIIAIEKLARRGPLFARAAGALSIGIGIWMLGRAALAVV